jgi:hypothetical protein
VSSPGRLVALPRTGSNWLVHGMVPSPILADTGLHV